MMGKSTGRQEQLIERAPQAANQEFLLDGSELLGRTLHTLILSHLHRGEAVGFSDSPLRVEYSLSPVGEELKPILLALREWGIEHLPAAETESHE